MPRNPKDILDTSAKIRAVLEEAPSDNEDNVDNGSLSSTEEDSEYEPNDQDAHLWDEEKEEDYAMYPNLTTSTTQDTQLDEEDEDHYTTEGGGEASASLSAAEDFGRAGSSR